MDSLVGKQGLYNNQDIWNGEANELHPEVSQLNVQLDTHDRICVNPLQEINLLRVDGHAKHHRLLNKDYLELAKSLRIEEIDDEMFLNATDGTSCEDFVVAVHVAYLKFFPEDKVIAQWSSRIGRDRADRRYFITGIKNWSARQSQLLKKQRNSRKDCLLKKGMRKLRYLLSRFHG